MLQIKFVLNFNPKKSRFPILIFYFSWIIHINQKNHFIFYYFSVFICFDNISLLSKFFLFLYRNFIVNGGFWGKILGNLVVLGIFEFAFWGIVSVPIYLQTHILHIMIYIAIVKMIFEKMLGDILPQGNRLILVKFFGCYENLSCILLLSDSNLLEKVCSFDDRNYLGNFLFWKLLLVPNMVLSFIFYK